MGRHFFKTGQYARIKDGIVFILGYENNRYQAVRIDRDEEREYFASDLTPWSPQNDDRVVELYNEDTPTGIIIDAGENESSVVWKGLLRQASWVNSTLEPAWYDEI